MGGYTLLTIWENPGQACMARGTGMSWTAILLIGWPLVSLASGPVVGRFVSLQMEKPVKPSKPEPGAAALPAGSKTPSS